MTFAYAGRKKCGCLVAAIVDMPDHADDVSKEVARFIRTGLAVERMTVEDVRAQFKRCDHEPAQQVLT